MPLSLCHTQSSSACSRSRGSASGRALSSASWYLPLSTMTASRRRAGQFSVGLNLRPGIVAARGEGPLRDRQSHVPHAVQGGIVGGTARTSRRRRKRTAGSGSPARMRPAISWMRSDSEVIALNSILNPILKSTVPRLASNSSVALTCTARWNRVQCGRS